jgi:hypothetical protein
MVAPAATRTHLVTRVDRVAAADQVDLDPAAATKAAPVDPAVVLAARRLVDRAVPAVRADPAVPVDPADLTTLAGLVVLVGLTTPVGLVGLAAPVGLTTPVGLVGLAAPADLAAPANAVVPIPIPAVLGMAMRSVVTSTAPRGATDRLRGVLVHRRDRTGAGRFLRPVGSGVMARSTTGVTRKPPFGIPGSTAGASGSSESGFRCKEQ